MILTTVVLALAGVAPAPQQILVPERPRDPWAFRCVLDGEPRMLTLALSKEMWLAYDTRACRFARAWKGGVDLRGAVYDTEHGPQPRSFGESYLDGLGGDIWSAEVNAKEVPVRVKWLGYQIVHGHAHMNYEVRLPDGRTLGVQETPEYVSTETLLPEEYMLELGLVEGMPGLYRSFAVDAIPDEVILLMRIPLDRAVAAIPYPPDQLQRETTVEETNARGERVTRRTAIIPFGLQRVKVNLALFFDPLPDVTEPAAPR